MTEVLIVLMGGRVCGTLERRPGGELRLEYFDQFRAEKDATPLSVSMPLQIREFRHATVLPWLQGLLPDNEAVIRRWAMQFQVSPSSPFALLGTPVGADCAGAVQFASPDAMPGAEGGVDWLSDDDVGARLRELAVDTAAWTARSSSGQFSLAGAQAKTALHWDGTRWGTPWGSVPTTHILKPAIAGLADHDINEHLCLDAASRSGLSTARTRVQTFGDQTALVVERYDRFAIEGQVARIHQEDLCQASGIAPERKYQSEGGPTPKMIAELLRRVMTSRRADDATARFLDALIWNWLVAGTDAHAKNYSLLLAGREVRFAPLYDIASALPYGEDERKMRLAMKVGGKYDVYPSWNTWRRAARELGIDPERAEARVLELAAIVGDAFADAASDPGVVALRSRLPAQLTDLVADRAVRCVRMIETTKPL